MITVKPFAALRPAEKPEKTAALPYDVMNSDEAGKMAAGNPASFLHIDKPEIDLPPAQICTRRKFTPRPKKILNASSKKKFLYRKKNRVFTSTRKL